MSNIAKTDNSNEPGKAAMRSKYLPREARVLDCFCGNGGMYRSAYMGEVDEYFGLDKQKVHDNNICALVDNRKYIKENDISRFNVFDLDDYGTPWKLFYSILKKITAGDYTFYMTDGLVLHQKLDGKPSKFVSALEHVSPDTRLNGLNRYYLEIFGTMLKDVERRFNAKIYKTVYFHNDRRTVYYWTIKLKKN